MSIERKNNVETKTIIMEQEEQEEQEVWKDLIDYEEYYAVSNLGKFKIKERVISKGQQGHRLHKERIVMGSITPFGYRTITLSKNGIEITRRINVLVAKMFVENHFNNYIVNHKDYDTLNNRANNLEWVSAMENTCHSYKRKNTSSKYTGVSLVKKYNKWLSRITFENKRIRLGYFDVEEDAYMARVNFEKINNINNRYL